MGISWGNVAAQGLLGAVMGGTQSAVKSIDDDEEQKRKKEMEEKKAEIQAKRDKMLMELKRGEEATERGRVAGVDAEMRGALPTGKPAWSGNKQGDAIDAGEVSELPLSEREKFQKLADEARKRGESGLVKEYMGAMEMADRETDRAERRTDKDDDRRAREKDSEARSQDRKDALADRSADRAERAKDRDATREAAERGNWKVDDKGRYVRSDGSIVMRDIREGGKKIGEEPVYAQTKPAKEKSDRDFVQQQILALKRKSFRSPEEEADLKDLEDEYAGLSGKKKAAPPSNRPPLSSFQR